MLKYYVNKKHKVEGRIKMNDFILVGYLDEKRVFTDSELCSKCKGKFCCMHNGCAYSPEDFPDLSYKYLKAFLKRGYASIDHVMIKEPDSGAIDPFTLNISWEKIQDMQGALILKARNVGAGIVDAIHIEGIHVTSRCSLIGPNGCKLPFNRRPKVGRYLIPIKGGVCYSTYEIENVAIEWLPYQEVLYKLYLEFR